MNTRHIQYGLIEETYVFRDRSRVSYGIAAYADAETDGSASVVASVRDVSPDKDRVLDLIKLCNQVELSPVHLFDVIEDFLN